MERHVAAWNARDWEALEALYHPDATIHGPADWPETGARRGWAEIRAQYESLRLPWSSDSSEIVLFEAEGERTVGRFRWDLRGKDSEIELAHELSFTSRWRAGRIVELRYFNDHADAVAEFER